MADEDEVAFARRAKAWIGFRDLPDVAVPVRFRLDDRAGPRGADVLVVFAGAIVVGVVDEIEGVCLTRSVPAAGSVPVRVPQLPVRVVVEWEPIQRHRSSLTQAFALTPIRRLWNEWNVGIDAFRDRRMHITILEGELGWPCADSG